MISNEGKVWDEFTITPGNPPASEQDSAQAPEIIIQQIASMIIQQISSIDKQSQPSYHLRAIIMNDSGDTKIASDFTIDIEENTSTF